MPKVGKVSYPDKFASLMNDQKLAQALSRFTQSHADKDFWRYMSYCSSKLDLTQRFKKHHWPGAAEYVKLGSGLEKRLHQLVMRDNAQDKKAIKDIYDTTLNSCQVVLNRKVLPLFYDSGYFDEAHIGNVTKVSVTTLDQLNTIAAAKLNLKKEKNLKVLHELIFEAVFGSQSKAAGLSKSLAKSGKYSWIGQKRDVFAELKKTVLK